MPGVSAETHDARGVLARLSDVIRQVVSQAGVRDAARATLALRHRRVLAHQHGADQGPAVHLPLLLRRTGETRKRENKSEACVGEKKQKQKPNPSRRHGSPADASFLISMGVIA